MNLEDQVVSLELAEKLKELGVKQESLFYWVRRWSAEKNAIVYSIFGKDENDRMNEYFSAFTVAELGEMLPEFYASRRIHTPDQQYNLGKWEAFKTFVTPAEDHRELSDTEANVRSKMLIYLLENKLI